MNEYFKRAQEVIDAVRSLGRSGLTVSLPDLRANGEMFFKIEGHEFSVPQILELVEGGRLHPKAIREFPARQNIAALGCGA